MFYNHKVISLLKKDIHRLISYDPELLDRKRTLFYMACLLNIQEIFNRYFPLFLDDLNALELAIITKNLYFTKQFFEFSYQIITIDFFEETIQNPDNEEFISSLLNIDSKLFQQLLNSLTA